MDPSQQWNGAWSLPRSAPPAAYPGNNQYFSHDAHHGHQPPNTLHWQMQPSNYASQHPQHALPRSRSAAYPSQHSSAQSLSTLLPHAQIPPIPANSNVFGVGWPLDHQGWALPSQQSHLIAQLPTQPHPHHASNQPTQLQPPNTALHNAPPPQPHLVLPKPQAVNQISLAAAVPPPSTSISPPVAHNQLVQTKSSHPQPHLLQDVPPAVTLVQVASIHINHAHSLTHLLLAESTATAGIVSTYRRHIALATVSLRAVLRLSASAQNAIPPHVSLLARCMLVEILLREADDSIEAEKLVLKGVSEVQTAGREYSDWKWRFYALQIECVISIVSAAKSNPGVLEGGVDRLGYAKNLVKRFISESSKDVHAIQWTYHFHLILTELLLNPPQSQGAGPDHPAALAALGDVLRLARSRGDWTLWTAIKLREATAVLAAGRWIDAGRVLATLNQRINLAAYPPLVEGDEVDAPEDDAAFDASSAKIQVPKQIRVHLELIMCVYAAIVGRVKWAKEWLAVVHVSLDKEETEEAEREGLCRIQINPPMQPTRAPYQAVNGAGLSPSHTFGKAFAAVSLESPVRSSPHANRNLQSNGNGNANTLSKKWEIVFKAMPNGLLYTLTFLVSAAIHPDAHGRRPKACLYTVEGIRKIDLMLTGQDTEGVPRKGMLAAVMSSMKNMAGIKVELCLLGAQISIVRSEFQRARTLLEESIALCRKDGKWEKFAPRVTAIFGMLAHARGDLSHAASCFVAAIHLCRNRLRPDNLTTELLALSQASYVLVRVAQGERLKTADAEKGKVKLKRKRDRTSTGDSKDSSGETLQLDLEDMVQELKDGAGQGLVCVQTAVQIVEALTCGEIVRAKQHLSSALTGANHLVNSHMKAVLLAFLASLFVNTRNDQAFKMLHSSFKLASGFGDGTGEGLKAHVGHASLGLWAGERLLQMYTDEGDMGKAQRQSQLNEVHRQVLSEA